MSIRSANIDVNPGASPIKRTFALALFVLPVVYVSTILSTAVHEILGHGLCAVLLGGDFSGFVLKWDAMGWAYSGLPATASFAHHILYLASGVIANIACGAVLLGLVYLWKKPHIQLALLVVSFTCLIDGISYVLWNAYHPVPPGDVGRIIWLWGGARPPHDSTIRWALLVTAALLFAAATFHLGSAVFVRAETLVLGGAHFKGKSRLLATFLFLALPGSVAWFTFDWNQLAPGIGRLPSITGAVSMVTVAVLLLWYQPKWRGEVPVHAITWRQIATSWICLAVVIMPLALWFTEGVRWA